MLKITVPGISYKEYWDEEKEIFVYPKPEKEQTLRLEHSLISLSKWESKWHKAFLSTKEKSREETIDYIKCMTLNKNIPDSVYERLTEENLKRIHDYIYSPHTATVIHEEKKANNRRQTITSELIYCWMIESKVPFECAKWHLNNLLTLIKIYGIRNTPQKKRSNRDLLSQYAAINKANKERYNTNG